MQNGKREEFPFEEKYTVESVAKELGVSVERVEKRLNNYYSTNLRHTRQYILKSILDFGLSYNGLPLGTICNKDFIEEYYRSRDENNEYVFDIDFSLVPEVIPNRRYHVTIIINELSQLGKRIGELRVYYDRFIRERRNGRKLSEIVRFRKNQKRKTEEFIRKSKEMFPGCFSYEKTVYIGAHKKLTLKCLKCGKEFQQTPAWHFKGLGMCQECSQEEARKRHNNNVTPEKFFSIVNEKFGDVLDFSETTFDGGIEDKDGNAKYVIVKIKKTGEKIKRQVRTLLYTNMKVGGISRGEKAVSSALLNIKIEFSPQKYYKITENCMPELSDIRSGIAVDFFLTLNGKDYIIEYNGQQHYMFVENWLEETLDIYKERVRRDNSVRKFCKENNITLIEIPYTVGTKKNIIEEKLREVLLNKEPVEKIFPTLIPESYE